MATTASPELPLHLRVEDGLRPLVVNGDSDALFEAAAHNATLKAHLDAWRSGVFSNLEQALIGACVHLARQNAELLKDARMTVYPVASFKVEKIDAPDGVQGRTFYRAAPGANGVELRGAPPETQPTMEKPKSWRDQEPML